jgi:hypothetical protein
MRLVWRIRIELFSSAFYPQVLTVPITIRYLSQKCWTTTL